MVLVVSPEEGDCSPLDPLLDYCGLCVARQDATTTFYMYHCCTDCGPDEVRVRKILCVEMAKLANVTFWDTNCQDHQAHLIVKGGLLLIDNMCKASGKKWTYYSSICKLTHIWRDHAKTVYHRWEQSFGCADAQRFALKLPPRCIAGRWGSVKATEDLYVDAGDHRIVPVIQSIVAPKIEKEALEDDQPAGGNDNMVARDTHHGLVIDEQHEYTRKIGRWRREVNEVVCDKSFWVIMTFSQRVHGPTEHLHSFLKKIMSEDELEEKGGHYAQLALGKGLEIASEYDKMMQDTTWTSTVIALARPEDQGWLTRLFTALVAYHAAAFHRRILDPCKDYPLRILRLALSPPDKPCEERRRAGLGVLYLSARVANRPVLHARSNYCSDQPKTAIMRDQLDCVISDSCLRRC